MSSSSSPSHCFDLDCCNDLAPTQRGGETGEAPLSPLSSVSQRKKNRECLPHAVCMRG